MAPIPNIIDTGAGEPIQDMYDKLNSLITAFNQLAGGTTGQYPVKVNGTDFNFAFATPKTSELNWQEFNIGDFNMTNALPVPVTLTGVTLSKIRHVSVLIKNDTGTGTDREYPLFLGGGYSIDLTNGTFAVYATDGGFFDNTDFNATGYNRGYITVGYID